MSSATLSAARVRPAWRGSANSSAVTLLAPVAGVADHRRGGVGQQHQRQRAAGRPQRNQAQLLAQAGTFEAQHASSRTHRAPASVSASSGAAGPLPRGRPAWRGDASALYSWQGNPGEVLACWYGRELVLTGKYRRSRRRDIDLHRMYAPMAELRLERAP